MYARHIIMAYLYSSPSLEFIIELYRMNEKYQDRDTFYVTRYGTYQVFHGTSTRYCSYGTTSQQVNKETAQRLIFFLFRVLAKSSKSISA